MTGDHQPVRHARGWLLVLLPAGFALGVIGGFLQEHRLIIGSLQIPWATALVVATLVVSIRALSLNLGTRLAGALVFGGWLIGTVLLALPNPSGDVVFTADVGAVTYLLAGSILGAASVAWPLFLGEDHAAPPLAGLDDPASQQTGD